MTIDWAGLHEAIFGSGGTDWTTVLVGLGGTAIGGGISYLSNRQNVAAQKEALAVQRDSYARQRRIERREEAYRVVLVPLAGLQSSAQALPLTRMAMGDTFLSVHQWLFEVQIALDRFPLAVSSEFRSRFELMRYQIMRMDADSLTDENRNFIRASVELLYILARSEVEAEAPEPES